MSKHTYFVYISLLVLIACGSEISSDATNTNPEPGMNTGPELSQDGKLTLPPCDQIASGDQSACETTIYQLKDMAAVPDDSRVAIVGVVSGLRINADNEYSHLILAVPTSDPNYTGTDFSAVWVYLNNSDIDTIEQQPPTVGSYIQLVGSVKTHFGQRQLEKVEQVVVLMPTAPVAAPIEVLSTDIALNGPRAWALEGLLVRISNIEVTNASPTPGPGDGLDGVPTYEYEVFGGLIINDFIYTGLPQPAAGDQYAEITGFLRYANNTFKLEPRNAQDIR
jgi:large repetitive protein